ncbi:MAG: NAD(P)(+) transhydrogenase (Re/Si-specific) subunit beta [Clostridia bacterium]|nr:NAD(P)(+) transhydrogenase (Re/Si-specific) subunit beta [Clostridia bacterium]
MPNTVYYVISAVLVLGVLIGISMMSKVKSANSGNTLSAVCALAAILVVMYNAEILTAWQAWLGIAIGAVIGLFGAVKVKMIEMPQAVALLNGLGGLASALVAILTIAQVTDATPNKLFALYTGALALVVGFVTFTGSLVAAGKLHKLLPQKPVVWPAHSAIVAVTLIATAAVVVIAPECMWLISVLSAFFGMAFAIRVGGADMPITISLLNSLSGVAGGIAGIAVGDPLLVAIGGIVGASGLLLTQIMCKAMNRSLLSILLGGKAKKAAAPSVKAEEKVQAKTEEPAGVTVDTVLNTAKKVMIVPGYGMALAQAQSAVKSLSDKLEASGVEVKFAIHPVAGRMPGHMNVLLCEVDVPYDKLYEMEAVNGEFAECDAAIIIGANDVVNPAANTAEGTPIYGMPVLNAAEAKNVIVCNFDTKPGYAGVPNPLYEAPNTILMLGDAKETVAQLTAAIGAAAASAEEKADTVSVGSVLGSAKKVMIVPGYGMALAQAQSAVKSLSDKLEASGVEVKFAIHPVAGRMPGHMNVLLCEVDVPYDKLYEMEAVNGEFAECDAAIIIGANDVVNPAANTAEGTPIYGMPVLNAAEAKNVIVCNFDTKPGYAGVPNPLYEAPNTILMLGDAKETVAQLIAAF